MRAWGPWLTGALFVTGLWASGPTGVSGAEDAAPVNAATKAYEAAYNTGDAAKFGAFWTEDADYTTIEGEHFQGRPAIQELMASDVAGREGTKLKIAETITRMLKPDVALQDGVLEFHSADGLIERSRYTAVWVKTADDWKLASKRDLGPLPEVVAPQPRQNPLEELQALRGEWQTSDEASNVHLSADWKLGKQFLEFDYQVTPKEGEAFEVLQLIGWDPVDNVVRSWFFDSAGGHGNGVWEKTEKGWFVLSSGVTPTGQVGGGAYEYEVTEKSLTMTISQREIGGRSLPDAVVKFTRK